MSSFFSSKKLYFGFQIFFVLLWLITLCKTDSFFSCYVIFAAFSIYCIYRNSEDKPVIQGWIKFSCIIFSVLFSGSAVLANYPLFTTIQDPALVSYSTSILENVMNGSICFFGGYVLAYSIVSYAISKTSFEYKTLNLDKKYGWLNQIFLSPRNVFLAAFLTITVIDLIYLLLAEYPGSLSPDSTSQIHQIFTGKYNNHHPYWYTVVIEFWIRLGLFLFHDYNAAVAVYSVFQILFMAGCYAYCLYTLSEAKVPPYFLLAGFAVFALLPYNIAFSISMWKDILFGGACLLMVTALFRIFHDLGRRKWFNYLVYTFGALCFCLWRTNGWLSFFLTFLLLILIIGKSSKKIVLLSALVLGLSWFMSNPVLEWKGIAQPDFVESLSIPVQQVSRVIVTGGELTQEEEIFFSQLMDLDELEDLYEPWLSDPVKEEIRSKDDGFLENNKGQFFRHWFGLFLRYPVTYIEAWVEQTKGYWNGGYDYMVYSESVFDNAYGIHKTGGFGPVASVFHLVFAVTRHLVLFEPFHSIGLHVWLLVLCMLRSAVHRRKEFFLTIPSLAVIATLLVATPVYSSFRYAYPVFVTLPLVLPVTFSKIK